MSTRSMSTWKYRHENKEPLEMDDGHERKGTSSPWRSHAAWDSTTREWEQRWLLWVCCLLCVASASPSQAAEYEEAVATFILFRLDPSCLHISAIHCYEHVPLLSFFFLLIFFSWAWSHTQTIFPWGAIITLFTRYPIKILILLAKCRH